MYAVLNMGYTPSQWIKLSRKERAFVIACIDLKIEEEKKSMAKARAEASKSKRKGRR